MSNTQTTLIHVYTHYSGDFLPIIGPNFESV